MTYDHHALSESEAAELWDRAARLQQEAQKQADKQVRDALPEPEHPEAISYDVALQAALESGIDEEHVKQAALEMHLAAHLDRRAVSPRHVKALGFAEKTVSERVRISASPASVRAALAQVVSSPAFESEPVDIVEFDEQSTALVYEVPQKLRTALLEDSSSGSFHYNVRAVAEIKRYAVIVSQEDDGGTEITVHTSLDRSVKVNAIALRVIQAIAIPMAAAAVALGTAVLISSFAPGLVVGPVLVGLAGAASGIGAGFGVAALFRRAYNKAYRKVRESFRKLLTSIRMHSG